MGIQALPTLPTNLPLDWIVIAALVIIFAADSLRSGAQRASIAALALPAALILYSLITKASLASAAMAQLTTPLAQALLFLGILVVMLVSIARIGISYGVEAGAPIQSTVAALAVVAILVTVWVQVPALESIWRFGPQVQAIFAESYRFWWLIGSYLALAIVRS